MHKRVHINTVMTVIDDECTTAVCANMVVHEINGTAGQWTHFVHDTIWIVANKFLKVTTDCNTFEKNDA